MPQATDESPLRSKVMLVTPEMAASWLANECTFQRPVSPETVERYADQMRKGQWELHHQGIAISADGKVVDGRHRLSAIVKTGLSIKMMVAENADPATFASVDRGYARSAVQIAKMSGISSASNCRISAVNTLLWDVNMISTVENRWTGLELPQVLVYFAKQLDICFPTGDAGTTAFRAGCVRGAVLRALLSKPEEQERLTEFITVLTTGTVIRGAEDNGALMLRNRLALVKEKGGSRESRFEQYRLTLSGIRLFLKGETVKRLTPPAKTPFPIPLDTKMPWETFEGFIRRQEKQKGDK